jgi:hypothetical protein
VKKLGNIVNPAGTSGMPISGLGVGDEIDFKILNQEHSIKIREITDSVIIEIRSEPIVMKLLVGESRELDLNQDGINDFKISLNKIFNGRATLILFSLPSEQVGEPVEKEPSSSLSWAVYLAIGMILIVIFILITFMKGKKKKSRKK